MPVRPAFLVLLILAVTAFLSVSSAAHPTDAGTPTPLVATLASNADAGDPSACDAVYCAESDAPGVLGDVYELPTLDVTSEERLVRAALHAIVNGPWWLAVALSLAAIVALLRARGLIQHRGLGAVLSVALSVAGGVVHHVVAAESPTPEAFITAALIAAASSLGLAIPAPKQDHGRLQERQ